jgi:hypothetical protein
VVTKPKKAAAPKPPAAPKPMAAFVPPAGAKIVIGAAQVDIAPGVAARVAQQHEDVEFPGMDGVKRAEPGHVIVFTPTGVDVYPPEAFAEAYPGVAL